MSGHQGHPMGMNPLDRFDPNYGVYDAQHTGLQRSSAPSTPYEGFGFWYRPDHQEGIYNPDPALYDQARSMQPPTMDVQLALKHKRTRSGCFTCRHRRVKCDETKPICDRCRKGNRQCEFPSKTSAPKKVKSTDPAHSPTEQLSTEGESVPRTIKEESEDETSEADEYDSSPKQHQATSTSTSQQKITLSRSSAKPSERSNVLSIDTALHTESAHAPPWKDLKPEMQNYLQFQKDHMTHYHYCFKVDPDDFVHGELINLALQFKPLLYAVVAFAAYHYTVRLPDDEADFNSFWKYYCKSIIKLRQFLESSKERNDLVVLTVLQLATFEEYMGDWSNLVSHHKAAYGILVSKYSPETIMSTERGRKIFDWYIRLDVIAGLMAARDATLNRDWIAYAYEWHEQNSSSSGNRHLQRKSEFFTKGIELIGHDTAHLFARANEMQATSESGATVSLSIEEITLEVQNLAERLDNLRQQIQELHNPSFASVDSHSTRNSEDAVFASDVPLFRGPLWSLNFVWIDWYGVSLLLKNSMLATLQKALGSIHPQAQPPQNMEHLQRQALSILPELTRYSRVQCEIFNAIAASTTAPPGATLINSISFGLSTVFLPRTPPEENFRYTLWARQQLANIERQGYVWPPHFRKEMANLWDIPEIEDWWLPNEEGKARILEEIRAVVSDRNRIAEQKEKSGSDSGRDLREIKGLFEMMDIGRRASVDALSVSSRLDSSYVSSSTGIMNAASLVSSPGSSAGSTSGLTSPRVSISDIPTSRQRQKHRSSVAGSTSESPVVQSRQAPTERSMTDIWEEQGR